MADFAGTLIVGTTQDYSNQIPGPTDTIAFATDGGATATFAASQFGTGKIATNVQLIGDGFADIVAVNLNTATSFSAANFTIDSQWAAKGQLVLLGSASDDTIIGSHGSDLIRGNGGADTLEGGGGNDLYFLDDVHEVPLVVNGVGATTSSGIGNLKLYAYDSVVESAGGGNDTVYVTPVTNGTGYTLPSNVENLVVNGPGNFSLFGNGLNNTLTANSYNDLLNGGAGHDILIGGAGIDQFTFDGTAFTDATASTPIFDTITNYDRSTISSGAFNAGEGDLIDVSQIVQSAFDSGQQAATALVRVVEDPSNAHSLVQVDSDGTANGTQWSTIAQLDGIHAGDLVSLTIDTLQSSPFTVTDSELTDQGHFGDFNGDGKTDLVWRNDDGTVATWQMNGGSVTASHFLSGVPSDWHIQGTGDFNGDGTTDILWLNDSGAMIYWQMSDDASFSAAPGLPAAPAGSMLAGIGDVDHDGKSDLVWRNNSTGAVTVQTMAGASGTISGTGDEWSVVAVGDFNGDHIADIMFRNESQGINAAWLMNGTSMSSAVFYSGVPADWHVVGTGDFDGNGTADLFWHQDSGSNAIWLMDGNGNVGQAAFFGGVSSDWHVAGTGDFNADHVDDVLWRNDNGATAIWTMNGANTPAVSFPGGVGVDWMTQAHHYVFV